MRHLRWMLAKSCTTGKRWLIPLCPINYRVSTQLRGGLSHYLKGFNTIQGDAGFLPSTVITIELRSIHREKASTVVASTLAALQVTTRSTVVCLSMDMYNIYIYTVYVYILIYIYIHGILELRANSKAETYQMGIGLNMFETKGVL